MDGSLSPYRSRPSRKTPAAAWLGPLGDQSGWPVTVNLVAFHGKLYGNWWNWWKIDGNWWEIDGKLMEIDGKLMGNWWEPLMKVHGIFLTNGFNGFMETYGNLRHLAVIEPEDLWHLWVDFWPPPQFKKKSVTNKKTQHLHFLQQLGLTEILWGNHGKASKKPWISMGYEHVSYEKITRHPGYLGSLNPTKLQDLPSTKRR